MTHKDKVILRYVSVFIILVFAYIGYIICRYHPTGITTDKQRNVLLETFIGDPIIIPEDSITISSIPDGLLSNRIRTNGASYGNIKYGHFRNTQTNQDMFLYLTGKKDTVCFKYKGQTYVTDDWRKQ